MRLRKLHIRNGIWTGRLSGRGDSAEPPRLEVLHHGAAVPGVRLSREPGEGADWLVTVPIPVAALDEGVHTVLIRDAGTGDRLDAFTIVTGEPLEDDIRAQLDLLRDELEMLKKAFRRHCAEAMP